MWQPALFTRNSGAIVRAANNERVGGFMWYIPRGPNWHQAPLSGCSSLFSGANYDGSNASPPWFIETSGDKVFIGEYGLLHNRLNVDGYVHPHARCDGAIAYSYGFFADIGTKIPSRAEMEAMKDLWRDEIGRLLLELNNNVGQSAIDTNYLRGKAKHLRDFIGDADQIGVDYQDNLWDIRAKQINDGAVLRKPLLVNAMTTYPDANWANYTDIIEVEGFEAQKKTLLDNHRTSSRNPTSAIHSESSTGRLTARFVKPQNFSMHSLSWGRAVAMGCIASSIAGLAIGAWIYTHRNRIREEKTAKETSPTTLQNR